MSLPASITVTQGGLAPTVTIAPGAVSAPPAGAPPYPLNSDPSVPYTLVWQDGALTWVPWTSPAAAAALVLENNAGALLLEDGAGVMLLEA